MAFSAGSVFVRLGADVDKRGFQDYEQQIVKAQRIKDIETRLGGDVKLGDFDLYERKLKEAQARASRRDAYKATLGADFDSRAFNAYERDLRKAERGTNDLVRGSGRLRTSLGSLFIGGAGVAGATIGFGVLAKQAGAAVSAFEESEKVGRRQALVIKTMGQDAGASAKQVNELAVSLMRKTGIDDEVILSATNVIRTFKNIRNEAGEGNKVFDRTAKATLDMASAFGLDTQSAAIQLGKALDNPAKGAAALSRTGAIAKDDVEKLKKMAESGVPILQQQRFVLEAVEKQVKGTAASNATATQKMRASFGELQEAIGKKFAPTFERAAKIIQKFVEQMLAGRGAGGDFVKTVKDIAGAVVPVVKAFGEAAGNVGKFFAQHPQLLTIAATMAGIAASVRAISKIGQITGLSRLAGALATRGAVPAAATGPLAGAGAGAAAAGAAAGQSFGSKAASVGAKVLKGFGWAGVGVAIGSALGLDKAVGTQFKELLGGEPGFERQLREREDKLRNYGKTIADALNKAVGPAQAARRASDAHAEAVARTAKEYRALDRAQPNFKPLNREIGAGTRNVNELLGRLTGLREGSNAYERTAKRLADAQSNLNKLIGIRGAAKDVSTLRERLSDLDKGSGEYRRTANRLKDAQKNLNDKLIDADGAGRKGAKGVRTIGDGASSAAGAVASAAKNIATNVNRLAEAVASKGVSFTPAVPVQGQGARLATGGWVGRRGQAGQDTVPAMLGVGEVVLNRHQQAVIEGILGPGAIDQVLASVRRPHYMADGGRVRDIRIDGPTGGYRNVANGASSKMDKLAEKFALGLVPPAGAGGGSTTGLVPQVLRAIAWARKNGWAGGITSGFRSFAEQSALYANRANNPNPVALPGTSNHESGQAVDVSDNMGFLRAMGSAPLNSRLIWYGPGDPPHFSITGRSMGGRIGFSAGGRAGHKFNSGSALGQGASKGLSGYDQEISDMERSYQQEERERGLDNADIVVQTSKSAYIDQDQLKNQTDDLSILRTRRRAIRNKIKEYRRKVNQAIAQYDTAIRRIVQAIKLVRGKGKKGEARRARYGEVLAAYRSRRTELKGRANTLSGDQEDSRIDLLSLNKEIAALDPNLLLPPEEAEEAGDTGSGEAGASDLGAAVDAVGGGGEPAASAPTAEQIAQGVSEQFASFNQNRADLFASFGSNFAARGSSLFSDPTQQAAGVRFFGATGASDAYGTGSGAGGTVVQNITISEPPSDPHVWAQQTRYQLETAIG